MKRRAHTVGLAAALVLASPMGLAAQGDPGPVARQVATMALPGGVEGLRRATGLDPSTPAGELLLEVTRRVYGGEKAGAETDHV